MSRRSVSRGAPLGLVLMLGCALVACYDPPKPACGFRCGPAAGCPADYTCGDDSRCHLNGSSPTLQCGTADASTAPTDAYSPNVVEVFPRSGASEVPVDVAIQALFDVDVFGVSDTSFVVFVGGKPVNSSVSYDPSSRIATLVPANPLPPLSQVEATLSPEINDPASGRTLHTTSWFFTTGFDDTSPAVTSATPGPNATLVSVGANIVVTFSEPVQNVDVLSFAVSEAAGMIEGTITMTNTNRTATYDPTGSMPAGTSITVALSGAITDASNNSLAPTSYSFTTAP